MPRRRPLALGLGALLVTTATLVEVSGCFERAGSNVAYEHCVGDQGADCSDGTECLSTVCCLGNMCTKRCTEDAECPAAEGFEVVCETLTDGRRCVPRCDEPKAEGECPEDLTCYEQTRLNGEKVRLCL